MRLSDLADVPSAPSRGRRSDWSRSALAAAAIVVLLVVAVVTAEPDGGGEDRLETARQQTDHDRDLELHSPRPSGDDAQRPAAIDEHLVLLDPGPSALLDAAGPRAAVRSTPEHSPAGASDRPRSSSEASRFEPARGTSGSPSGASSPTLDPGSAGPEPAPSQDAEPHRPGTPEDTSPDPAATTAEHSSAHRADTAPRDRVRCPRIDLHAIGDLPGDADDDLTAFGSRFRAAGAPDLEREELVCAEPIQRWRDLVIQRLYLGTIPEGVLAASADGRGEAIRFTFPEWKGYRLTGEDDWPFNLGGRPTHREHLVDHSIVHTTNGGLVSRRGDTHGFLVINGAWTIWADRNGRATMGFPETQPALSSTLGIYQDFAHGWLQIPGVVNPFEAELLGPEAYVWHPVPDPQADVPPDALGNILEVNSTSWFVDRHGVRHWIPDVREFNCVRVEHGARKITVRGWVAATFPLGEAYACPTG